MTTRESISQLGYVLLGLIEMQPSSGYQLRKIFESTPMGRYSSSPGAIYPAIKKLQATRAVNTRETVGKTARAVQLLTTTRIGREALHAWLRTLPSRDEVGRDFDIVLLKFSYLDLLQDNDYSMQFLDVLEAAISQNKKSVQGFMASIPTQMPLHGSLALQFGMDSMKTQLHWVRKARQALGETNPNG